MPFWKSSADTVIYVYNLVPRGVHTAARITINECGADGFHVRLESIARAYTHHGFVGSPNEDKHAGTWAAAERIATKLAADYERDHPERK